MLRRHGRGAAGERGTVSALASSVLTTRGNAYLNSNQKYRRAAQVLPYTFRVMRHEYSGDRNYSGTY